MTDLTVHDLTPHAPEDAPVVLAVHGITANGLMWQPLASALHARLDGNVRILAPDLRGRGCSRALGGPYGLDSHGADVAQIAAQAPTPVTLVGHSMGGFVALRAAALAGAQVTGLVLVDGGVGVGLPPGISVEDATKAVLGPAMDRLALRFADFQAYLDFWAVHPAVGPLLAGPAADAVTAYLAHDLVEVEDGWASSCVVDAVLTDAAGVLTDDAAPRFLSQLAFASIPLVRAEYGLLRQPVGLYPPGVLEAAGLPDTVHVTTVAGSDHYDVILSDPGLGVVTDLVAQAVEASTSR